MKLRKGVSLAVAGFAAATFSGCSLGGQTGEGDPAPPWCQAEQAVLLKLSQASPQGYSAQDVLAYSSSFKQSAVWPASTAELDGAAPHEATIEFSLQPAHDQARFIRHVMDRGANADELCVDTLEIDVKFLVQVKSKVGGWDHAGEGTLISRGAQLALLVEYLPLEGDLGPYQVDLQSPDEELAGLKVHLLFSPFGQAGMIELTTLARFVPDDGQTLPSLPPHDPQPDSNSPPPQVPTDDLRQSVSYPLAHYPAHSSCGADEWGTWQHDPAITVDLSAPNLPFSRTEWQQAFSYEVPFVWKNGDSTQLKTSATLESMACLEASCGYCGWDSLESFPALVSPLGLSLRTLDGGLDGQYMARSRVELAEAPGKLHALTTSCSLSQLTQAELLPRSGLWGQLSPDGSAYFECELAFDLATAEPHGIVALRPYLPGSIAGERTRGQW